MNLDELEEQAALSAVSHRAEAWRNKAHSRTSKPSFSITVYHKAFFLIT